jgi:hypothetical protein
MDDAVQQALRLLVEQKGKEAMLDARRCEGLLRDYCPSAKHEVRVLMQSLEKKCPQRLMDTPPASRSDAVISSQARLLAQETALADAEARWAVQSWAFALGWTVEPSAEGQLPRKKPDIASLPYATIAIAGAVLGFAGHILSLLGLFGVRLGVIYLLSGRRVLYVASIALLVTKLTRTQGPQKQIGLFIGFYLLEIVLDTVYPSPGVGRLLWNICGMLVEWLLVAALFFSLKDTKMMGIAAGIGAAQGLFSIIIVAMLPNELGYFLRTGFDFSTTGLCLAYGIRRQITGSYPSYLP